MTIAIQVDHLGKTYPRTWKSPPFTAIKDVSFDVQEGEVFGFIGPNGAGKSTTIKIITGATPATLGHARIFGLSSNNPTSRKHLGFVPENPSLPEYLTPLEMLMMSLQVNSIPVKNHRDHCLSWLDKFGLSQSADKLMHGFSKGMAQRVALAHGMVANPKLLILDEPLSGLDPIGRRDVVEILASFKENGGSIFLTSHVLHDVERLADRFGLIHKGELKTIADPKDLVHGEEELLVRTIGLKPVVGMLMESGNRWSARCSRSNLWSLLHAAEMAGHEITEIKPTLNLETAFLKYVETQQS